MKTSSVGAATVAAELLRNVVDGDYCLLSISKQTSSDIIVAISPITPAEYKTASLCLIILSLTKSLHLHYFKKSRLWLDGKLQKPEGESVNTKNDDEEEGIYAITLMPMLIAKKTDDIFCES